MEIPEVPPKLDPIEMVNWKINLLKKEIDNLEFLIKKSKKDIGSLIWKICITVSWILFLVKGSI